MSPFLTSFRAGRRQSMTGRQPHRWQSLAILNTALGVAVLALGLAYLLQTNTTATSGFVVKDMERQRSELDEQHRALEIKVAELQSFQRIEGRLDDLDLVAKARPEYPATGGSLAIGR